MCVFRVHITQIHNHYILKKFNNDILVYIQAVRVRTKSHTEACTTSYEHKIFPEFLFETVLVIAVTMGDNYYLITKPDDNHVLQ
jgi:hypothetical protein